MDVVLQNFRRSFGPTTPFFKSLSLDPLATMEELYRRADKCSTLEDNICVASQTVMITAQSGKPTTKSQPEQKASQARAKSVPKSSPKRKEILPNSPPPPPPQHLLRPIASPHPGSPRVQVASAHVGEPGPR